MQGESSKQETDLICQAFWRVSTASKNLHLQNYTYIVIMQSMRLRLYASEVTLQSHRATLQFEEEI